MSKQPKKSSSENQRSASSGKDEMNLVDFPIATLHHKDNRAYIECTTWHSDAEKGRYQQKWIVAGNSVLGLPHEIADQTVLALILIWHEQGAQKTFSPTIYRILKILNLPDSQHYYELLKKTLLQLDGLRIRSERAFWDNQKRQHVSLQSFGLFDSMRLAFWIDEDGFDESEEKNQIEWSTPLWKSLQAGYLKTIDLSFYLSLDRPLTRRLYRFLDKQLRYRRTFEIDIFVLASRLGMQSYAFPSKVQEKLKPAIDELIENPATHRKHTAHSHDYFSCRNPFGPSCAATSDAGRCGRSQRVSNPSQAARPWPLLANVPLAQQDYVLFDVERTGADAQQDRILQIAAIKVIGGVAVDWFNCYVNPGDREISYALRFVQLVVPSLDEQVTAAQPQRATA